MGKDGSVSVREGIVMSQDAPVNTGAGSWPELLSAEFAVARMQAKLHLWAARDAGRRFGDLFNLVYDPALSPPFVSRGPPAAPGVRLSPRRALHVSCPDLSRYVAGGFGVHGVGMLLPR